MSLALLAPSGADLPLVAKLAVAVLLTFYVGGPLVVLTVHKQPARMKAAPLLSLDVVWQIDPEAGTCLQEAARRLTELGFVVGQPLRIPTSANSVGYGIVGEGPDGDVAESYVLVRRTKEQVIRRDWTNFHSQTRLFARTVTSNSVSSSGIPSRAGHNSFSAPGLKDLARLYEFHSVRVSDSGGRRRGAAPLGNQAAFVESEGASSTDNMVARGYARRSGREGETLRMTAKGAFLVAWRQLPPWNNIAAAKARRRLTELEARVSRAARLVRSA